MSVLLVSTKCTDALSNTSLVQSAYSIYYTGSVPPTGSKDLQTVNCTTSLIADINTLKTDAETAVSSQLSSNGPYMINGGTALSFDSFLGTSVAFDRWCAAINAISDGTYIDYANEQMEYILGTTVPMLTLRSTMCDLQTYIEGKITTLSNLLVQINLYTTTIQSYISQLAIANIDIPISDSFSKLTDGFQVYNTSAYAAVMAVSQAKITLGSGATLGQLKTQATTNIIINGSFATTIDGISSNLNDYTTQLSA